MERQRMVPQRGESMISSSIRRCMHVSTSQNSPVEGSTPLVCASRGSSVQRGGSRRQHSLRKCAIVVHTADDAVRNQQCINKSSSLKAAPFSFVSLQEFASCSPVLFGFPCSAGSTTSWCPPNSQSKREYRRRKSTGFPLLPSPCRELQFCCSWKF